MVLDCGTDEEKVEVDEVEEDPWWFKFTVDGKFNTLNTFLRVCKQAIPIVTKIMVLTLEVNRYRVDRQLAIRLTWVDRHRQFDIRLELFEEVFQPFHPHRN